MLTNSLFRASYRYLQYVFIIVSVTFFALAQILRNNNLLLISVLLLFIGNVLYGFGKIRERFIFTFFNFACMFFLFGRNVIELFSGEDWQIRFSQSTNQIICTIIYVSLFSLLLGAILAARTGQKDKKHVGKIKNPKLLLQSGEFIKNLKIVSFPIFLICAACLILTQVEKMIVMYGKEYAAFYTDYDSSLPSLIFSIAALTKFCLCIFLATNPSKKYAVTALGIYLIGTIPAFVIGQRNALLSAALVAVCYYLIRDYISNSNERKWFGKFEIISVIVLLPFLFAFLSMYESIRLGRELQSTGIWNSILNLFRSQGVTYDIIGKGVVSKDILPSTNFNYTFGPILEYFRTNSLSSLLFGTHPYAPASLDLAMYGNSFGDTISYLNLGNTYFDGAGLGSAYMIENYVDFGFIGVAGYSFALGFTLIYILKLYKKNIIGSFFALTVLLQIFMLPRSSATGWVVLLLYLPMYVFMIGLAILTGLTLKKYYKEKG